MNSMFASGLINSFVDHQEKERTRRENNTRDAINFLVSTGKVRDYNDLLPMMDTLFQGPAAGVFSSKGGSGMGKASGGKGQPDVHGVLAKFLNPAFAMQQQKDSAITPGAGGDASGGGAPADNLTLGGQTHASMPFTPTTTPIASGAGSTAAPAPTTTPDATGGASTAAGAAGPSALAPATATPAASSSPTGGAGAPVPAAAPTSASVGSSTPAAVNRTGQPSTTARRGPLPALMTQDEVNARTDDAQRRKQNIEWEQKSREIQAAKEAKLEEIAATNKTRRGSDLHQLYQTKQQAFEDANGRPATAEEDAKLMTEARAEWQSAGRAPVKLTSEQAAAKSWIDAATAEHGGTLTPAEEAVERVKARHAWALAGQTETGAQKLSRAEALAKYREQLTATTPDDLRSLSQSVKIGDDSTQYLDTSGFTGKEKAKAMVTARQMGIVPVTAKQVEQLENIGAASANLTGFMKQIESKLPAGADWRVLKGPENLMSKYFQTDAQLASASGWDITIIPTLRALGLSGRITNKEIDLGVDARPKITDDLATARAKMDVVQSIMRNAASPILSRGGTGTLAPTTGPGGETPPAAAPKPGATPGATPAAAGGPAKPFDPKSPAVRNKARKYLVDHQKHADDATIDLLLKKPGIEAALAASP